AIFDLILTSRSLLLHWQTDELGKGLQIGIISVLLICVFTGGLAVWQHYIIRLLLSSFRTFPMRAPQFLHDATTRFLLRRVGGGYSFSHRLLLDYLADTETRATLSPNASSVQFPYP